MKKILRLKNFKNSILNFEKRFLHLDSALKTNKFNISKDNTELKVNHTVIKAEDEYYGKSFYFSNSKRKT